MAILEDPASLADPTAPQPPRRSPWRAVAAIALVVAAFGAGFVAREAVRPTPAPTPSPTPSLESIEPAAAVARTLLPSTVLIRSEGVGSGIVYEADGLILTAAHVVE